MTFAKQNGITMGKRNFSKKLINWYNDHHRNLPWRSTKDPYRIWLSEIILQQTRVAQGMPYYENFVKDFPTVAALARASEEKVLRAWQGLGYYSRARNLHACAKEILSARKGVFPKSYEELLKLPGIGPYTAAAISSMAFDGPVAVVDGNVFRVLSRVFGIEEDISSNKGRNVFSQLANALLDHSQPGLFNQAVMEFGALHCTPRSPDCATCIFSSSCIANQKGTQGLLPIKNKRVKTRIRYFNYFVFSIGNKLAMKKRREKDIWNGLYEFYLLETTRSRRAESLLTEDKLLKRLSREGVVKIDRKLTTHLLTHQKIYSRFVSIELPEGTNFRGQAAGSKMRLFNRGEIRRLPKPTLISRFLHQKGILE